MQLAPNAHCPQYSCSGAAGLHIFELRVSDLTPAWKQDWLQPCVSARVQLPSQQCQGVKRLEVCPTGYMVFKQKKFQYLNFCYAAPSSCRRKNNFLTIFSNTIFPECTFLHFYFQSLPVSSPQKFQTFWCVSQKDSAKLKSPLWKSKVYVTQHLFLQNTPLIFAIYISFPYHNRGLIFDVNRDMPPFFS